MGDLEKNTRLSDKCKGENTNEIIEQQFKNETFSSCFNNEQKGRKHNIVILCESEYYRALAELLIVVLDLD